APQRLHAQDQGGGGAELTDFLDGNQQGERAAADATVVRREGDGQHVLLREELFDVPGKFARFVDVGRARFDPLQAEVVHHLTDLPLLLAQAEVHQVRTRSRAMTTRWTWLVPS